MQSGLTSRLHQQASHQTGDNHGESAVVGVAVLNPPRHHIQDSPCFRDLMHGANVLIRGQICRIDPRRIFDLQQPILLATAKIGSRRHHTARPNGFIFRTPDYPMPLSNRFTPPGTPLWRRRTGRYRRQPHALQLRVLISCINHYHVQDQLDAFSGPDNTNDASSTGKSQYVRCKLSYVTAWSSRNSGPVAVPFVRR